MSLADYSFLAADEATCLRMLEMDGLPVTAPIDEVWCNATWDTVMCWPATQGGTSVKRHCPPLKGLDPDHVLEKHCTFEGLWAGRNRTMADTKPQGYTPYFEHCLTQHTKHMLTELGDQGIDSAQRVARNARIMEFIGLSLSLVTLLISVAIFCSFRRLRVFRTMLHMQLCLSILGVVIVRLILYIDVAQADTMPLSMSINSTRGLCEFFYFLLEYFKTVAFMWTFIEGFCLHNTLVITVYQQEPKMKIYTIFGWGFPLCHCLLWLLCVFVVKGGHLQPCLGSYYMNPEYWVLDGLRLFELFINCLFLLNVLRVLWNKVGASAGRHPSETEKMRKSTKAALMLIPLLGIPNVTQIFNVLPQKNNLPFFEFWTYFATFAYMFQGAMIAVLYCFTNREVIHTMQLFWEKYRLAHSSSTELRRPSRSRSTAYWSQTGYEQTNHSQAPPKTTTNSNTQHNCVDNCGQPEPFDLPPPSYESSVPDLSNVASSQQPTKNGRVKKVSILDPKDINQTLISKANHDVLPEIGDT